MDASTIDLTIEQNVLTVHAERTYGSFSRQLFLGDTLDSERLTADYADGVLTIRIPVAEQAKPRRIEVRADGDRRQISG